MSTSLFYITVAAYLAATFVYIGYLATHKEGFVSVGGKLLMAGFAVHTVTILSRWIESGRTPATNFHESLTFFAWVTVGLYLVVLYKYKLSVLGTFVAPFVLLLLITASFLPMEIVPLAPVLESYWLPFHIFLAFLGNAAFALAFCLSVMYLIQNKYLKSRKVGGLYFLLPSLDVLDEVSYRCISYGFTLLTLAMITGAIWAEYALGTYWQWKHRQVFSLIEWFLYAALLHGRLTTGWRGRRAAVLSCVAFGVLISSYVIINVLAGEGHGFIK